jgi:hypothetical protein
MFGVDFTKMTDDGREFSTEDCEFACHIISRAKEDFKSSYGTELEKIKLVGNITEVIDCAVMCLHDVWETETAPEGSQLKESDFRVFVNPTEQRLYIQAAPTLARWMQLFHGD